MVLGDEFHLADCCLEHMQCNQIIFNYWLSYYLNINMLNLKLCITILFIKMYKLYKPNKQQTWSQ